jgi:Icc-related predicted phosphoesterase
MKILNNTKLLLVGDFHGKVPKIKKDDKDFDAILCTGDLPLSNELRRLYFKHTKLIHEGKELYDIIDKEKYIKLYTKGLNSQFKILDWLNSFNKPVFLVYGNHDYDFHTIKSIKHIKNIVSLNILVKNYKHIKLLSNKIIKFNNVNIIGFSDSFSKHHKTNKFKKMWNNRFKKLFKKMNKKEFNILLTHDPPNGVLDLIKDKNSFAYNEHYGDNIMIKYVKKYQPNVLVCGHMHENQGKKKLKNTLVINAGYGYENHYGVLKIKNKKIKVKLI